MTGWIIILIRATKPGAERLELHGEAPGDSSADEDAERRPRRSPRCRGSGCGSAVRARCWLFALMLASWPSAPVTPGGCRHYGTSVTPVTVVVVEFVTSVAQSGVRPRLEPRRWPPGAGAAGPRRAGARGRLAARWPTYDARRDARETATERALSVARAVADSPTVTDALGQPRPERDHRSRSPSEVRRDTDVDFVTVMDLDRIRYTHPDPDGDRQARSSATSATRAGRRRRSPSSTPARSARRCAPSSRSRDGAGRVVALVVGRHHRRRDRPSSSATTCC